MQIYEKEDMEAGNERGNLGGGSSTTNAWPFTRRNSGWSANPNNQDVDANVGAGNLPVDIGAMY